MIRYLYFSAYVKVPLSLHFLCGRIVVISSITFIDLIAQLLVLMFHNEDYPSQIVLCMFMLINTMFCWCFYVYGVSLCRLS